MCPVHFLQEKYTEAERNSTMKLEQIIHATSAALTAKGKKSKWEVFAIIAVGTFMANLDTSIVNVSIPAIARAFGVTLSGSIEWIIIAYLMVIASLLLAVGWLSDRIERRRLWAIGLTLFLLGSLLCGSAPSLPFLITARGLQGIGGSFILALGPAILSDTFPLRERGRVSGMNAVVVALSTSMGPILGGIITQFLSWHWIFYVNVPLSCLGLLLTWRLHARRTSTEQRPFDFGGACFLVAGLGPLTVAISFGQQWGWLSQPVIILFAVSAAALIGLVIAELRAASPLLDAVLFRHRIFLTALISLILFYLAIFSVNVLMPFYLENLCHFPSGQVGLLLTPIPLSLALIAPFTGRLSDRIGSRYLTALGFTVICSGLLFLCQLGTHSSLWEIEWRLAVIGIGQAIFISPNNGTLLKSSPRAKLGLASGALATSRTIGQSVSIALAGAIFAAAGGTNAGHVLLQEHALLAPALHLAQQVFLHSIQAAFLVSAAIAGTGMIVAFSRGKERFAEKLQ